ncbi:hypothetical protein DPMN_170241 [Dreissena polymorpha]|uniref:Uncharacterized protein n=1 Tax=Dreissena polymorpha TaxID=45954 RepID=A0A9D4IBC6_DREPO|nr:hypothetical protein DPMN_170241 [Dreissena polymorpha]
MSIQIMKPGAHPIPVAHSPAWNFSGLRISLGNDAFLSYLNSNEVVFLRET